MNNLSWHLFLFTLFIVLSSSTHACIQKDSENINNPCPSPDDIIFPLPHENTMVFRKVVVPQSAGKINARAIWVGSDNGNIFERPREVVISGAFPDRKNKNWFNLLGKYEVSLRQYLSLEPGNSIEERYQSFVERVGELYAPSETDLTSVVLSMPVVGVTKHDAEDFLYRYNQWCLNTESCRDSLPTIKLSASDPDTALGYFRLPSEISWEYAARGGADSLANDTFRSDLPFEITEYANYAYVQDFAQSSALPIGSLGEIYGFHDLLGNVAEIVSDQFKPSTGHGHSGATTVRGGSFTTHISNLRLSRREERPVFRVIEDIVEDERQSDTGFRVAIGAPALATPAIIDSMLEGESYTGPMDAHTNPNTSSERSTDSLALQSIDDLNQAFQRLDENESQPVRAALRNAINLAEIKLHQSCVGYIRLASVFAELLSETDKNIKRLIEIQHRYTDLAEAYKNDSVKHQRYEAQLQKTKSNIAADNDRFRLYGTKYREQVGNLRECGTAYGSAALDEIETQLNNETNSIIFALIKRHFVSQEGTGDSWVQEVTSAF